MSSVRQWEQSRNIEVMKWCQSIIPIHYRRINTILDTTGIRHGSRGIMPWNVRRLNALCGRATCPPDAVSNGQILECISLWEQNNAFTDGANLNTLWIGDRIKYLNKGLFNSTTVILRIVETEYTIYFKKIVVTIRISTLFNRKLWSKQCGVLF